MSALYLTAKRSLREGDVGEEGRERAEAKLTRDVLVEVRSPRLISMESDLDEKKMNGMLEFILLLSERDYLD